MVRRNVDIKERELRSMRRVIGLTSLVLVLSTPLQAQTSTITNGGFEELGAGYFPKDWGPVGEGVAVSTEARTGRYALRIQRRKQTPMPPETGLNRAWEPGKGRGGAMLDTLRGVVRVYYRVLSAEPDAAMAVVVIPMGASGVEDTGEPRAMRAIPNDDAGDGEWHETLLPYDYSSSFAVKWVHVGIRITGGAADLLVDDFELVPGDMSVLVLEKVHVYPDSKAPDRSAMLTATVTNIGRAPSGPIKLIAALPPGMTAEGPAEAAPLVGDAAVSLRWRLRGPMKPGMIRLDAEEKGVRTAVRLRLVPRVELESALAQPSLVRPGGTATVVATAWNRGTAIAEGWSVRLLGSAGRQVAAKALPAIAPGKRASVTFTVDATGAPGKQYRLQCGLIDPEKRSAAEVWPVTINVTDSLSATPARVVGPLTIRTGNDRTLAQVRLTSGRTRRTVGVMPHLGSVTLRLPSGKIQTLTARYRLTGAVLGPVRLQDIQTDEAGGRWTFRCIVTPLNTNAVRVQIAASCSARRRVIAFEGPTLLAGEQSGGAVKAEAIFPGLEWLEGAEVSSNDLDIRASHPDRPRWAPHPNKVTIPAMAVRTSTATAALYWNAYSRWDGVRDRPQPVFASPDRIEGRAAHRMGLMAPSAAHGWPENGIMDPKKPDVLLPANVTWTLSGVVQVMPAEGTATEPGALAGVMGWFRWFRPAPPATAPQGSDLAQIGWSMHAYMTTLWDKEGNGWYPYLLGPAIWRKPSFDPTYAYDLLEATRILPDHPERRAWQERLDAVLPRLTPETGENISFGEGDPAFATNGLISVATSLVGQQQPDGGYGFDADRRDQGVFRGYDYHQLGPPGAVELGTIARNAYLILRAARLTGDATLYEAGVRSLNRMAAFTVPRAAQVWEVPVHTPDILAAADAVDAYVEAYRYSGDHRWLVHARRWAAAGLPFVYVWNAPGKLWMRWGSIPVFGATQYLGSWFGNLVQWNGLRHAAALLKLYRYDPVTRWGGLSWRDIAVGITRSAMHQQSLKQDYLGLWPDSLHTITSVRAQWEFAPRLILRNVFDYLGRSEEPQTVRVTGPSGAIARIATVGTVRETVWSGDALRFTVKHPRGMRGSVLVSGITKPAEVRMGARRLPEYMDRLRSSEACWRYDQRLKAVAVRIPSDGPAELQLSGVQAVRVSVVPPIAEHCDFDFSRDEQGWMPENHIATLSIQDGALVGISSGPDPYLIRPHCKFDGSNVERIVLRIRADGDGHGQFYWTTSDSPSFDETKVLQFTYSPDGQWHEVELPVGKHPGWHGKTITAIRIDPATATGVKFGVDRVQGR